MNKVLFASQHLNNWDLDSKWTPFSKASFIKGSTETTMPVSHRRILWISSDEMIKWGQKSTPPPPNIFFPP